MLISSQFCGTKDIEFLPRHRSAMSRVLLKEVTKTFSRRVVAVDRLTLEVKDKEFFVILGPSGCGKSTILRLIAGLEQPDSGEIYIGDKLVNQVAPKDRDVAMVFQNYALYPHMSVFENMAFALKLRGFSKDEIYSRILNAARVLGIEELLNRKPAELSGGQRQRVAVGRAIVRNPKVFLFDEPLSNLDARLRVGMRAELARLHQQLAVTVIYVTHDQVEAMTLGERIGVMKDGKLLQVAEPKVIYDRPINKFVAGFIGSPPMNFFVGKIVGEDSPCFVHPAFTIDRIRFGQNAKFKEVILGIRPEHIQIITEGGGRRTEDGGQAIVEVVENLGNEAVIYLKLGQEQVVVRSAPDQVPKPGDVVNFRFDIKRLHFFDINTENRLGEITGLKNINEWKEIASE